MKRIWDWANSTINAINISIEHTVTVASATIRAVKSTYRYFRKPASDFALQTMKGFFSYWQIPGFFSVLASKKSRPIVTQALSANIVYLVLAALLAGSRKYLPRYIPQMENQVAVWSIDTALFAVNAVALIYMLQKYSGMLVDNTFNSMAISKAVSDENPSTNHGKPCEHGYTAQYQAGCASTFYYMGNIGTVMIAELAAGKYIPGLGEYAAWPLRVMVYGQALVEYKLSSIGNCTQCRYEKLTANNGYAFGMGLAFYGLYEVFKFGFSRFAGIQNSFLADAIFNAFFQISIVSAIVNDKPLSGKTRGIDVFLPSRIAVEAWMGRASAYLAALYNSQEQSVDIEKEIKVIADCPPVFVARTLLLDANIQTKDIVVRPSFTRLWFDLYEKPIVDFRNWLVDLRKDPFKNKLPFVADYVPDFILPPSSKQQINLAFDKRWTEVIAKLDDFVAFVRARNGKKAEKGYSGSLMDAVLQLQQQKLAQPSLIEQKPSEDSKVAIIKIEPDVYLVQEPVALPPSKQENPRPPRRVKVDKYLDPALIVPEQQEDQAPKFGQGNVRLSSSGMFRRSGLSASGSQSGLNQSGSKSGLSNKYQ